jgi:anti-sigma regulatory factor (Ser/Thr protein kinase)
MELAVGEAFTNAIKYGEKGAMVSISVDAPTRVGMSVEMNYPGCNYDSHIRYPQDVLNAEGGFGRCIMHKTIDSMEYSFTDGRTTLRMTKRRI